jgi:hypothetical protein
MGSQYVDFSSIQRRLYDALSRQFPGREVTVSYDGTSSPRIITASVDGVVATQQTWFIDESFSTMVAELTRKLRAKLGDAPLLAGVDRPQLVSS